MLRKIINTVVILPLAIIFIVFAVANRHLVTLSFDPFDSSDAALGLRLPLFVVILAFAIFGVVAGGVMTWFGQRHWRRLARLNETEARNVRAQLAGLRERSQSVGQYGETQLPGSRPDGGLPAIRSQ